MTTKKKVILGISIATIVGVGGYFLYKYFKDKNEEEEDDDDGGTVVADTKPGQDQGSAPAKSPSSSGGSSNRPDDVLEFQKYANGKGYKPKLKEDGLWGPKTSKAWKAHKDGYKKQEATQKATGELSGQAKQIWDSLKSQSSRKLVKNTLGTQMIKVVGNKTGFTYYYTVPGQYFAYDKSSPKKKINSGNYANNGKTLVITQGKNKGKTITGSSVLKTAYKAVDGDQYFPTMSKSQINAWVDDVYLLFNRPNRNYKYGTSWHEFDDYWKKLKTASDWSKVFAAYGTKKGKNLFEAIKYHCSGGRTTMNATFAAWGSSNRF